MYLVFGFLSKRMKVYIHQAKDGHYSHTSHFLAAEGFAKMGWEIVGFQQAEELDALQADEVVVGYVDMVQYAITELGIEVPILNDYPEVLQPFMGRKIWTSTINTIAANPDLWGIFVKPMKVTKRFTGVAVHSTTDLIGCGLQGEDTEVWCSELVDFKAEWRCFLRYGKVLDVRPYKGDWRLHFDPKVIEAAVEAFRPEAPNGCSVDFGVTADGQTLLVEVNEGYSLGHYGLPSLKYAKLLSARWAQILGVEDHCDF